jgi:hypothetical protein
MTLGINADARSSFITKRKGFDLANAREWADFGSVLARNVRAAGSSYMR